MSRRRKGRAVHGIVLLDKPSGWSSNQALQKVRWLFQARKAGHTGNLDPFATGMLPICLGEASKTAAFMLDAVKTYVGKACFGVATATGDIEGEPVRTAPVPDLGVERINDALEAFTGEIEQVPPMYSALKHKGQPLYKLARAGQEVERAPRRVTIHTLDLLAWNPPHLEFRVRCSKGTYVRTLAEDIAAALGCCAHLQALRRLEVEPFREEDMIGLEALVERAGDGRIDACLLPVDAGLTGWPRVDLAADAAARFSHGNPADDVAGPLGNVRVYGPQDRLLGLGEILSGQRLKAKRIMNL
jgi:tRNA pseudouridine55 synthase